MKKIKYNGNKKCREHLKSVILYGSYAKGDYTQDSDIDMNFQRGRMILIWSMFWISSR